MSVSMSVLELSAFPKLRRIGLLVRVNQLTDEARFRHGQLIPWCVAIVSHMSRSMETQTQVNDG